MRQRRETPLEGNRGEGGRAEDGDGSPSRRRLCIGVLLAVACGVVAHTLRSEVAIQGRRHKQRRLRLRGETAGYAVVESESCGDPQERARRVFKWHVSFCPHVTICPPSSDGCVPAPGRCRYILNIFVALPPGPDHMGPISTQTYRSGHLRSHPCRAPRPARQMRK